MLFPIFGIFFPTIGIFLLNIESFCFSSFVVSNKGFFLIDCYSMLQWIRYRRYQLFKTIHEDFLLFSRMMDPLKSCKKIAIRGCAELLYQVLEIYHYIGIYNSVGIVELFSINLIQCKCYF